MEDFISQFLEQYLNSIAMIENFFALVFKESYKKLLHETNINDVDIIQMGGHTIETKPSAIL